MSPVEVAPEVGISVRTARKYKSAWNKKGPSLELTYKALRNQQKNKPEHFKVFVELFSENLGMPKEEVLQRLQTPWGLKQLLMRKWPNYAQEERLKELQARVNAAVAFVRFANQLGISTKQLQGMVEELAAMVLNRMLNRYKNIKTA